MKGNALIVVGLLIIGLLILDNFVRCKVNGLVRDDAIKVADRRLKTKFKGHYLENSFVLQSEQLEDDKSWLFVYTGKDCVVGIIIDKCGVADIGGWSKGCF